MTERNKTIFLVAAVVVVFSVVGWLAAKQKSPIYNNTTDSTYGNTNANTNTSTNATDTPTNTNSTANSNTANQSIVMQQHKLADSPIATMVTSMGTMKIKFYTKDAPNLSKNFIELAKKGYYDGLTFHRVISGFMIQGGDPLGTGTGGESSTGEGLADEAGAQALRHERGAVAWAKSSLPNSIGSQFYIVHSESGTAGLNGEYSVFGQVIEGLDVIDKIAAVQTDANDKPVQAVTMTKVTIQE